MLERDRFVTLYCVEAFGAVETLLRLRWGRVRYCGSMARSRSVARRIVAIMSVNAVEATMGRSILIMD